MAPGLYETQYDYDDSGRLVSIATGTRETVFAYDARGFLSAVTDPELQTTYFQSDALGRVTRMSRSDGSSVWFDYDKNGNMTVLTNPAQIDHAFDYNHVNLKSAYHTPMSGSYEYTYDKDRRLTKITFPSLNWISHIYESGRLKQIQTPDGDVNFTYVCGSEVGTISKGDESIAYAYDGSLMTSERLSGTVNQVLYYSHNRDFNIETLTYGGGRTLYTYDDDGLLIGSGDFVIARNRENGLPEQVSGGTLTLEREFNGYGDIKKQTAFVGNHELLSWSLERDNNGRIVEKTETVGDSTSTYSYTYDPVGRLRAVRKEGLLVEDYQYDPNGTGTRNYEQNSLREITGRSYAYSDEDHLLTAGGTIYEHDLDGFLERKTDDEGITEYRYSLRGELLRVDLPDGTVLEYVHDPLGRRIAKLVDGVVTEKYLWQGLTRLLAVFDAEENLIMRFEYADDRMPVAMTMGGAKYYLACDQIGSLRIVADESCTIVKRIDYDSFGNVLLDSNPGFRVPFGFAGGLHDRDTGLVRFGFRDYDPDVGRWTAKDPIFFSAGDTDLYGYCLNDPINLIDLNGLFFEKKDVLSAGMAVMVTTAKIGGLVTAGMAQTVGFISTFLGVFAFPSDLYGSEELDMYLFEIEKQRMEIEKEILDLEKKLSPIAQKLEIAYSPCP
jgi:RHS repeat-associated protein